MNAKEANKKSDQQENSKEFFEINNRGQKTQLL